MHNSLHKTSPFPNRARTRCLSSLQPSTSCRSSTSADRPKHSHTHTHTHTMHAAFVQHGGLALRVGGRRQRRTATCPRMTSEEPVSAAERTRQLLSETKPLVKFSRQVEEADDVDNFKFTSGTSSGGFDVWLVTAVLTLAVPIAGFAIGVATGNILINPR